MHGDKTVQWEIYMYTLLLKKKKINYFPYYPFFLFFLNFLSFKYIIFVSVMNAMGLNVAWGYC